MYDKICDNEHYNQNDSIILTSSTIVAERSSLSSKTEDNSFDFTALYVIMLIVFAVFTLFIIRKRYQTPFSFFLPHVNKVSLLSSNDDENVNFSSNDGAFRTDISDWP